MRYIWMLALLAVAAVPCAQTKVLTLGTFHFNFPNLDVAKVGAADQIDVLAPKYQAEIKDIVNRVLKFKPTIIVIERQPGEQTKTDSLYNSYLQNKHPLSRAEDQQIGFRVAKAAGLKKLYCVDEWGNFNESINNIISGKDSAGAKAFETYFDNNPDSAIFFHLSPVYRSKGILAALQQLNNEKNIKKSLGNYLIGLFKYEAAPNDFMGVDFETGRWFNRNLKIFRNIQKIHAGKSDRILVIYGAGHLNLLNYFFECSPEYQLVKANDYLK